jgi:UDP-GlcNAc:undecaprenyl-phosphate GlcNAc-1-phosphate transferase
VKSAIIAFGLAALAAAALTPVVRRAALSFGVLDHALSSRKTHGRPVPRLGGVAIVAAFYLSLALLYLLDDHLATQVWENRQPALALAAGGLVIAALGVYDDVRGANARVKFAVQFAVAAGMYFAGFRIEQIANPFGPDLHLGPLIGLPFTMLWIAGVVNAMNLIDGLDGLAGGVALIAVTSTMVISAVNGRELTLLFTGALAGAVLGFLRYNFNPATIFMGDTGSMFLGFVLAVTAIRSSQKSATAVAIAVPILALGIPIADTLLAMVRRAVRGVPMFSADRGHIHHRLMDLGLSHRRTVLVIYGGSAVLTIAALALSFANSLQAGIILVVIGGVAWMALRALGYMDVAKAPAVLEERRRNLELQGVIRRAGDRLRTAANPTEVWQAIRSTAPVFGASRVGLTLGRLRGRPGAGPWEEGPDGGPEALRARYRLIAERPGDDFVELTWTDGRTTVHRDTEIAVEQLCELVSAALDRIERTALEGPNVAFLRVSR